MKRLSPSEIQLKAAVVNHLLEQGALHRGDILISELPLAGTSVRADLVALSEPNELLGIEVKSDRDSLTRLQRQLDTYNEYFDQVVLVVGERHVARALEMSDNGVEIWLARADLSIEVLRSGSKRTAPKTGIQLLTQKQARKVSSNERAAYCDALRDRFSKTSAAFWSATRGREVASQDLRLLSRFEDLRSEIMKTRAQRDAMWSSWENFFAGQKSVHSSSVS
jgi:hypothetical protein